MCISQWCRALLNHSRKRFYSLSRLFYNRLFCHTHENFVWCLEMCNKLIHCHRSKLYLNDPFQCPQLIHRNNLYLYNHRLHLGRTKLTKTPKLGFPFLFIDFNGCSIRNDNRLKIE